MFKKILLLFPKNKLDKIPPLYPPLGIGYLSENLSSKNISHEVLDMRLGHTHSDLINTIKRFQPDLIGITMMTFSYTENYALLNKLKSLFPKTKIVVGGAHVSAIREKILTECPSIDYAVFQEGEETLLELCTNDNTKEVKGIYHRDTATGETAFTGHRPMMNDFNSIPYPKFEKFELEKYITDKIAILTSRGCPYECTYCAVGTSIGGKFRPKTPHKVIEELSFWTQRGYTKFDFIDDNFTLDAKRAKEICSMIKDAHFGPLLLECSSGIRADRVDRELLSAMRKSGFYAISIPVESGSNKVLKAIKKSQDISKVDETIKNACELGFDITLFFLIGSPTETQADLDLSVQLAQKYPVYDICFHNLVPFPGTELYKWVEKNNYFLIPPEIYLNSASLTSDQPYFQTPEFSKEERINALRDTKKIKISVQYKAYLRKYKIFGILAPILAYFTSITSIQLFLAKIKPLRKLIKSFLQNEHRSSET
ncbi:MAG: radical SAM protein [Candidatus Ancaeobacter aquaticus]|nr:radical SAM protein [Candidatus Ancaeobacter aquaticus]